MRDSSSMIVCARSFRASTTSDSLTFSYESAMIAISKFSMITTMPNRYRRKNAVLSLFWKSLMWKLPTIASNDVSRPTSGPAVSSIKASFFGIATAKLTLKPQSRTSRMIT